MLTVVFSSRRPATCSGFAGYFFFSYKFCLAEVEGSMHLSRIPGCPAAGLRVAIVGLWEILNLSHTHRWTLEHTRDPGRLEPALCYYNNYCAQTNCTAHTASWKCHTHYINTQISARLITSTLLLTSLLVPQCISGMLS